MVATLVPQEILTAALELANRDKKLGRIITAAGVITLIPTKPPTPFHALARSIIYQQLNGKAAESIWQRVLTSFGGLRGFTPKKVLVTKTLELRALGVSTNKILALYDLAKHIIEQKIPSWKQMEKYTDEEIVEKLTKVRGIGKWTVHMILIFALGRLDVWPHADFGVRNGYALMKKLPEMPSLKEFRDAGEKWKPYRSIAAWYLWRAVDLSRSEKRTRPATKKNS